MVKTYNEDEIKEMLPHRDPFLFVDVPPAPPLPILEADIVSGVSTLFVKYFVSNVVTFPASPGSASYMSALFSLSANEYEFI